MPIPCTIWSTVEKVLISLGSGFVSAWLTHRFVGSRERKKRLREFVGFMRQVKEEAEKVWTTRNFGQEYTYKCPNIRHAAVQIEQDFAGSDRVRFKDFVDGVCRFTEAEANAKDAGKQRIISAVDALISHVETA